MKKVLLTGGTGFIGRHSFAPLLSREFEIHATYKDATIDAPGVTWHQVDLLEEGATRDLCTQIEPTHLLHFAWYVNPADYKTSPENARWVQATKNLVNAFSKHGGTRAMLAGTCMEYDWGTPQELFDEAKSPLKPHTPYAEAKVQTFEEISQLAHDMNLSFAWGRIFFLYGPHEAPTRLVPYVINSLRNGTPANCSSGKQVRDFLHVSDVADAFCATLESDVSGAINIASGSGVSLRELILSIADRFGRSDLINFGALLDRADEPERLVANTTRLKKEVGWEQKIGWNDGITQTIEWWKTNRG